MQIIWTFEMRFTNKQKILNSFSQLTRRKLIRLLWLRTTNWPNANNSRNKLKTRLTQLGLKWRISGKRVHRRFLLSSLFRRAVCKLLRWIIWKWSISCANSTSSRSRSMEWSECSMHQRSSPRFLNSLSLYKSITRSVRLCTTFSMMLSRRKSRNTTCTSWRKLRNSISNMHSKKPT